MNASNLQRSKLVNLRFKAKVTLKASEKPGLARSFVSMVVALEGVVTVPGCSSVSQDTSYFSLEGGNHCILDTIMDRNSFSF
jgi:hypothetical protein